jgi:AcrR family transcriptional regulator
MNADRSSSSRRRPATDRGDPTRQKLLKAAIDVFGRRGFQGASTRALAQAAGVNLQAIPYYFGSKEGLYIATAEHIAAMIAQRTEGARAQAQSRLAAVGQATGLSRHEARGLLIQILQVMGEAFIGPESEPWARFLIREQMEPTEAFQQVYRGTMEPLLKLLRQLVGRIRGQDPNSQAIRLRTLSLLGGLMVFRVAHATVIAQVGWKRVGPAELAAIRSLAVELVDSLIPQDGER